MSSMEEKILALFQDTIPALIKEESPEKLKRLANLIQSKEYSNIFVCIKEPNQTFEQYETILQRFKCFAVWLLGQFFYLLNSDKFKNVQDVIIDVQLSILEQLSKKHLHIYHELAVEYCRALNMLMHFYEDSNSNSLDLKVFVPVSSQLGNKLNPIFINITIKERSLTLVEKLLRIYKFILCESFKFYSFDSSTDQTLDNLTSFLCVCNFQCVLEIFEIFVEIATFVKLHNNSDPKLINKLKKIASLLEQFTYDIYNKSINVSDEEFVKFEVILYKCLLLRSEIFYNSRIIEFLALKALQTKNLRTPNDEIKTFCCNNCTNLCSNKDLPSFIVNNFESVLFLSYKKRILQELFESASEKQLNIFVNSISNTWCEFSGLIFDKIEQISCSSNKQCEIMKLVEFLNVIMESLLEIEMEYRQSLNQTNKLIFFKESNFLFRSLTMFNSHFSNNCSTQLEMKSVFTFFTNLVVVTNSKNIHTIFYLISCPLLIPLIYSNVNQLPTTFFGSQIDHVAFKQFISYVFNYFTNKVDDRTIPIEFINRILKIMSSGLLNDLTSSQIEEIITIYKRLALQILKLNNEEEYCFLAEGVFYIVSFYNDFLLVFNNIFLPLLTSSKENVLVKVSGLLSTIICCCSNDFTKIVYLEDGLKIKLFCNECFNLNEENMENFTDKRFKNKKFVTIQCQKNKSGTQQIITRISKYVNNFLTTKNSELNINSLNCLPSLSQHQMNFHSDERILNAWISLNEDENKDVRLKVADVIGRIIESDKDKKNLDLLFSRILEITKRSLQHSNFSLQETLIRTIGPLSFVPSKHNRIQLECLKIFIYLIMIPTSKYKAIAVNRCFQMAEKCSTTVPMMYCEYRQILCELIVHLCVVNQGLNNDKLGTSLEKVSVMLGFYGVKDFVAQESSNLLPFFVAKIPKRPAVKLLIAEIANLTEVEIDELLANKYGTIFLHIFLNETVRTNYHECMNYIEEQTKKSGPTLRKENFRVIFNELFLHFHKNRQGVLTALELLAKEVSELSANNIPDYIRMQFLGILLYFDIKLITKTSQKDNILCSLADILRYMGTKHITPLRFKIITMLQTANYEDYPQLICHVWEVFVQTCQIDLLGPQLATIFVSILPLISKCQKEVNNIFKYLIIQNENAVKEFIPDLFFVKNDLVDATVVAKIDNYLKIITESNLKEKIKQFLKYLKHEHCDVRVYGLKYLKKCFEESRVELNELIIGCNGIDVTIVELIEVLAKGCREKDKMLKLACGDLIGELGAVEPSHLPRKYSQGLESFSCFIHEDGFIVSSLNELTKSFQTDKNKQNTDRFALAIQEILKTYDISPETNSRGNRIWKQLPTHQQELIQPFLSSRYMMAQSVNTEFMCPIYGSTLGTSFTLWLYNWTCCLINSLTADYKSLLQVCLPSMRQDHRVLMHFLPYILLHFLLEDTDNNSEKCFIEFQTITTSLFNKKQISADILNERPMPIPGISVSQQTIIPEQEMQVQCTKVVFVLLDFLDRWLREWQWQNGAKAPNNENFKNIKLFLNRFSKLELAKCNYQCEEYARALMHLESHISENSDDLNGNLTFLAEIYAQLDESDGVAGVIALQQTEPSIEQRILALEVSGKLPEAVACYERIQQPMKLNQIQGLVQCHLDLGNVNTALNFIKGSLETEIIFEDTLWEMQAEPLWRLGRYEDLSTLLQRSDLNRNKSWGVQIGHSLLHLKDRKREEFKTVLNALKLQQVENFGAATLEEGAYQHGYYYILRLHALNELEQLEKTITELELKSNDGNYVGEVMKKLMREWDLRLKVVQDSVRVVEPLLALRRVGLDLGKRIAEEKLRPAVTHFGKMLGEYWLYSANMARVAGFVQQAYTYTLKAEEYSPDRWFLEKAQLHWLREEHEQSLRTLKRGLEVILPENVELNSLDLERKKVLAEGKLLIACYNDEISNVDMNLNIKYYKEAVNVYSEWEKSLVCLAQYYDKLFKNLPDIDKDDDRGCLLQVHIMVTFGTSLSYGTKYVYQSMPRILSVWFDFGTRLLNVQESLVKEARKRYLLKMTKEIDDLLKKLPPYVFLTAFSQILSRICHPQRDVFIELKSIIIKVLKKYPQQTLWMLISVINSSYPMKAKNCKEILSDSRLKNDGLKKLVDDFISFNQKLIELCKKEIPSNNLNQVFTVSQLSKNLPKLLNQTDFSQIMMPTQKFRKLVLPNPESNNKDPFPNKFAYIVGIEDQIVIVNSLQKPRKIVFRGSDGNKYIFMLKARDDLRKDFRLLEFNDVVNQLLAHDSESRQRRLNIRLYSVAPLNEDSGLIEWVPNLLGLRPAIMNLLHQNGHGMSNRELMKVIYAKNDTLAKKRQVFTKILLPNHPPVLGDWFKRTFPDAQSWFTARTAYIRTTAVMSMAGYILGLGDRHGENILLDSTCGDAVHVDFNCIFNKGETFDWPERVPFRLTQNMVGAMGPLGVEGVFRKSCACALRVLRTNRDTLMSIVTPVAYDLVSFSKDVKNVEQVDKQAMEHIKNIESRLRGVIKSGKETKSIPLSVEGQANILIAEAMSVDNLCQMYVGWGAFL